jgi:hypothetical protein
VIDTLGPILTLFWGVVLIGTGWEIATASRWRWKPVSWLDAAVGLVPISVGVWLLAVVLTWWME